MSFRRRTLVAIAAGGVMLASTHALYAQTKPPGYWVALVDITDEQNFYKEFPKLSAKVIVDHGGKILSRAKPEALQGSAPTRVAIFEFADVDAARATYQSKDFQDVLKIGERSAKISIMILPADPAK